MSVLLFLSARHRPRLHAKIIKRTQFTFITLTLSDILQLWTDDDAIMQLRITK